MTSNKVFSTGNHLGIQVAKNGFNKISKIDYSIVDKKYLENNKGKINHRKVRNEALKFLALSAATGRQYSPSRVVDMYWHELILNTRVYNKICKKLGVDLQHVPSDGSKREQKKAERNFSQLMKDYPAAFGSNPPMELWGKVADSHNCTCNGGGSNLAKCGSGGNSSCSCGSK